MNASAHENGPSQVNFKGYFGGMAW